MSFSRIQPRLGVLLCLALLLSLCPPLHAAADTCTVTLPSFQVTISDQEIPLDDEYPFLVYQDITYLPLTFYGCQAMGLLSSYTTETGLVIKPASSVGQYKATPRVSSNTGTLTATIATGKITLNGTVIDNSQEKYPFLLFRDVTYLPMTWHNMYDILGCYYDYKAETGLVVARATQSGGIQLNPAAYIHAADGKACIAAWEGYFWYLDENLHISRTPITGGASEVVYEPAVQSLPGFAETAFLQVYNDQLYLQFQYPVTTTDYRHRNGLIQLRKDGSYRSLYCANLPAILIENDPADEFNDTIITVDWSFTNIPCMAGNLCISQDSGFHYQRLGATDYVYGWSYWSDGSNVSAWSTDCMYEIGDTLYLLGCRNAEHFDGYSAANTDRGEAASSVCKVDLKTGNTVDLGIRARAFYIQNDRVYYISHHGELYSQPLQGGPETTLHAAGTAPLALWVLGDDVYYTSNLPGTLWYPSLYLSGQDSPLSEHYVEQVWVDGDTLIAQLYEGGLIAYRGGKEIDHVDGITASAAAMNGDKLVYCTVE